MDTKFKSTFNVVLKNHTICMGSLGTSLLLCYGGARVHAFGVSISTSSSIKCCSKSFNISMVVVTYYISMVCFCDVTVCIIMPGFEILKVHYYSMFFSDALLKLLPTVHTCEFKCQSVVATPSLCLSLARYSTQLDSLF